MPLVMSSEAAAKVNADMTESWLSAIPVHARTFIATLLGANSPITQNNLSNDEQLRLIKMIDAQSKTSVPYDSKALDGPTRAVHNNSGTLNAYDTNDTPLKYLLGRAHYQYNPDNSVTVTDSYDWDYGSQGRAKEMAKIPVISRIGDFLDNAYRTATNDQSLGNKILSIADDAGAHFITSPRPVKITIKR